jgi:signal transduction histidine kinase
LPDLRHSYYACAVPETRQTEGPIETHYLPAKRSEPGEVTRVAATIARCPAPLLLDQYPVFTLVLNRNRQIVYANSAAKTLIGQGMKEELGKRIGEAIGCVHAADAQGGCGTSSFCRLCGAAKTQEAALAGRSYADECLIKREIRGKEEQLELLVWTRPFSFEGLDLLLVSAQDISEQRRREVLERVFYHDIANTVNGIYAAVELMEEPVRAKDREYFDLLKASAYALAEEISSQRSLKEAEAGELALDLELVDARQALEKAVAFFTSYIRGKGLGLAIDPDSDYPGLESDPALLRRVLVNMIKNALEAASPGETVGVRCERRGNEAVFSVRNGLAMSEDTRKRVFMRSFSTKGKGRGLGTYGMKLLGEGYLKGAVTFVSSEAEGTVFSLSLPLVFPRD